LDANTDADRQYEKHWAWFAGLLATMGMLGFGASFVLMLPLGMATDGCYEDSTEAVCTLSAAGQNVLVWIPWMCLVVGSVAAVAGAAVAERRRWTPLIGIPVGMAAYFAMVPIGWAIALNV
jgi:TRAP-type transport system small permease protein